MRRACALAAAATLCAATRPAAAVDPADLPPPPGAASTLTAGVGQHRPYWTGSGPTRAFLSATLDAGALYFSPTMAAGYGRPHYKWFGVEAGGSVTLSGTRYRAGLHGAWPGIEVRTGLRYEAPVQQHLLPPQEEYLREELETEKTSLSRYFVGEVEITGSWPMPGGSMFVVASGYAVGGVPDELYVFEESLKTVVAPPWLWRGRVGYLWHTGWLGSLKLGAAFEGIHVPLRDNTVVLRAGPILSVALTHHLEAVGAVMLIAASPDSLGIVGADLGQIGLRYRWATGDRWAEFP
jgi:opacity protein-like surface antigen